MDEMKKPDLWQKILLSISWARWRRNHTMQDFEDFLLRKGCTKIHTRESVIFTTPNGGKIEITDTEIIINNG